VVDVLDRVTTQVFVWGNCPMIAAPVQCDVDGIPKRSHDASRNSRFDHSIACQYTAVRRPQ
jgi:hypothetical protein